LRPTNMSSSGEEHHIGRRMPKILKLLQLRLQRNAALEVGAGAAGRFAIGSLWNVLVGVC
jgi:hypothetical protein